MMSDAHGSEVPSASPQGSWGESTPEGSPPTSDVRRKETEHPAEVRIQLELPAPVPSPLFAGEDLEAALAHIHKEHTEAGGEPHIHSQEHRLRTREVLRRLVQGIRHVECTPENAKRLEESYHRAFIPDEELYRAVCMPDANGGRRQPLNGVTEPLDAAYFQSQLADPQTITFEISDPKDPGIPPLAFIMLRYPRIGTFKAFKRHLLRNGDFAHIAFRKGRGTLRREFESDLAHGQLLVVVELHSSRDIVTPVLLSGAFREVEQLQAEQGRTFTSIAGKCLEGVTIGEKMANFSGNGPVLVLNWQANMDAIGNVQGTRELRVPVSLAKEHFESRCKGRDDADIIRLPAALSFGVYYGKLEQIRQSLFRRMRRGPITSAEEL